MTPPPLRARVHAALRLQPFTAAQLRWMLSCSDKAARNALDELASHGIVCIVGMSWRTVGARARLWGLVA